MDDEIKRMCKWDRKKLKKDLPGFSSSVADPRYVCTRCLHVAHSRKRLCDPLALGKAAMKEESEASSHTV